MRRLGSGYLALGSLLILAVGAPLVLPVVGDEVPIIRVTTKVVMVPVSVSDAAGHPVSTLTLKDFVVDEDGQRQNISHVADPGQVPLELALLVDVSGSVHGQFEFERKAAGRFLQRIVDPGDTISLFSIGVRPRLVQGQTSQLEVALRALQQMERTRTTTAFFDTVSAAARSLRKAARPGAHRVVVALSDGEDNNSDQPTLADALRELQQSDCLFYAINPGGTSIRLNRISVKAQQGLATLASHTGGAAFLVDRVEDLEKIFGQIAADLQSQYLLGYQSTNPQSDGGFRRITVRVVGHPELNVRARHGYYPHRPDRSSQERSE